MKKYVLLCMMFLYGCTAENTPETFHSETQQSITADFDFDGFHGTYYHYNPDTEKFDEWDELNLIERRETDKNTETWYYIDENGNEILIDK